MKISRIDVVGQNGNDGEHYDGVGREWLIQSGLIATSGESGNRGGQESVLDSVQVPELATEREEGGRGASLGSCSGECPTCRCGGAESEGR